MQLISETVYKNLIKLLRRDATRSSLIRSSVKNNSC